jgi:hypothetical protein
LMRGESIELEQVEVLARRLTLAAAYKTAKRSALRVVAYAYQGENFTRAEWLARLEAGGAYAAGNIILP